MMTTHCLSIRSLGTERDERFLFSDLSFTVNPGEIWQVVGANGSGKTSLLKILCGLLAPSCGEVLWAGAPIDDDCTAYQQNMIFLGHLSGVKGELTVLENLKFFTLLWPTLNRKDLIAALDQVGLGKVLHNRTGSLSAGQQRRLALARLVMTDARLWILDEPFTALDSAGQSLIKVLLKNHVEANGMVIFTTHQSLGDAFLPVKDIRLG